MMNTRVMKNRDGSQEIVRVLDDDSLGCWSPQRPLAFEKSVVWLRPLESLDFVRVALVRRARSRRGPLVADGAGVVVGYTKLTTDAPRDPKTGAFCRRLFYLRDEDSQLNMNQFPPDAIDPRTVLPGIAGDPPNIQEVERGYPWYLCRSKLGLPVPPITSAVATS
jgi:hypothetical protein